MAFAERLKTPPSHKQGPQCSVGQLLKTLTKPEAAALTEMLQTRRPFSPLYVWSENTVLDAILAEGHSVSRSALGNHRRGQCRCPEAAS